MALAIGDTLSVLLPTPDETALLAACLHSGDRARDAWARWRAGHASSEETLCNELAATRTLLPLLAASAVRNGLDVGRRVLPYLRAATLREDLRAVRYRQIAAEALAALHRDGIRTAVVRGAALAATVYDGWALRHCHDLDLLVPPATLAGAVRAIAGADCVPTDPAPDPRAGALMRHTSGLQIALHTRPFAVPYYDVAMEKFSRASESIAIDGVSAQTPSGEATLVHVLGHASYSSSRRNLRWVTDAWHLVIRRPDLDWSDVVARIEASRLALPVWIVLCYLAEFGMAIPSDVLASLEERAAHTPRAAEDVALGGVHAGPRGDLPSLWRATPSWRGRVRLARWVVAPSPAYLRSAFDLPSAWLFPLCYVYRPARFVAGTLTRRAAAAPAPHGA